MNDPVGMHLNGPTSPGGGILPGARKYLAVLATAAAHRFAHVGDNLARPVFFGLVLFIFCQLWRKVLGAGPAPGEGFTAADTLWYMVMTEAILLSTPRLDERIDEEIKTGGVAVQLGRPCNYLLYHLFQALGETLPLFLINLAVGSAVAWALIGPITVSPAAFGAMVPAVILAFVLHLTISLGIAFLAFWTEDAAPFFWVYQKLMFILGGLMIPLDFFPGWLRTLADVLPFRAVLCGPARLLVRFSWADAAVLLRWQAVWITIFLLLVQLMFDRASRKVQIHGG